MTIIRIIGSPLVLGLLLAVVLAGCSGSSPTRPDDVPATHTVRKGSAWHARGLESPVANCATCHGNDLRGGTNGEPSCYSCHGAKWN